MRILHISTRLILGGSQENTILSCEGQARRGHDVHLAFGPIYGPEGSLLARVEEFNRSEASSGKPAVKPAERQPGGHPIRMREGAPHITTHVIPHLLREINPLADWRCYGELRRLIRELKPDIVHTHSSKAGVLGRAAGWDEFMRDCNIDPAPPAPPIPPESLSWQCRVIHTIHGPPFMPIEGSFAQRMKGRANNLLYTLAERFAARRCHRILSVADAMTREFLRRRTGKPEQYQTVYSGMEVEPFLNAKPGEDRASSRRSLGIQDDDFVIGTVARLAQHKGHDDLLDALGEDLKRHPTWKLLWVGDGWWRERLVKRAEDLGLRVAALDNDPSSQQAGPARIILTGLVPPERIPMMMRAMDVLAHPSYREGLPRTVPQALLAGVCPIGYDCDGTGEVIRNNESGLLVPTGDRTRLREAVVWAHDHPAERAAMAARGREECRVKFSAETMVAELENVYAAALGT